MGAVHTQAEKSGTQKQAAWLSFQSRWREEADAGHRPLTCRPDTGVLQTTTPKTVGSIRNVTDRTQGLPNSQAEDSECRMAITLGTSSGKRRVPAEGRSKGRDQK